MRILITGSEGLVGKSLTKACLSLGHEIVPFDLVRLEAADKEDIIDTALLASRIEHCDGVVHLAAISRVAWGETNPDLCHRTNVEGTKSVLSAIWAGYKLPWLLFSSSREVYGNPIRDLVYEDDPIQPLNHYGRSKAAGENLVNAAREDGMQTAIVRLSNVYGGRRDHPDRAVPSLVSRALAGQDLVITGGDNYFDFVHVDDCVAGLINMIDRLSAGEKNLPPINFATGVATSLRTLAKMASEIGGGNSKIIEQQARSFDVSGYCGSPQRARALLGWQTTIDLRTGLEMVAEDFRLSGALDPIIMPDPKISDALSGRAA